MKKNSPFYGAYYRHVVKVEKIGEREIKFTFDGPGNRELPQIVGQLPVLPKHWWEGTDKSGRKRDITQTTLEPPLGSGPYRLKDFVPGRTLVYEKVDDYWGKDLNVIVGTRNFQTLRYEYFRDSTVALEAFKGDQLDWRVENSAKDWANSYDFPAVREKRVIREEFPIRNVGVMQSFAFNIRRDKFKDPRVRRAFNFAFDFEEMNRQLFSDQYKRIGSYFEGTELAATGMPSGKELEILETVRDKVPADLFTKPYTNPVGGNPAGGAQQSEGSAGLVSPGRLRDSRYQAGQCQDRRAIRRRVSGGRALRRSASSCFTSRRWSAQACAWTCAWSNSAQYENRLRQWDFDIIVASWAQSLSPGNEQRGFWSSQAADQPGSRNLVGIKNPAIDTLIERVIFTKDRAELVAATQALDRVLLWNFYVVPQWTYPYVRTARWDRFAHPDIMPKYGRSGFPSVWWWDADKGRQSAATVVDRWLSVAAVLWRLFAGAAAAGVGSRVIPAAAQNSRSARHVGLRRSQLPAGFSAFQLRQSECAERRGVFADWTEPPVQPVVPDLQFAQQLYSQGRCCAGDGAYVRDADGPLGRRARRDVRTGRAQRSHFR